MSPARRQRGIAAIESLLAVPVLLMVGLGAVQFALVYQARHALGVALHEAARAGSVAHAAPEAIRDGLARGMLPWLQGASDVGELAAGEARARAHVAQAEALGWLRLERQSPTAASFDDWAEPARDRFGEPIEGVREIPNDDLVHRATRALPGSGAAGRRDGEPIGAVSGQTLADANLLRLRMAYGVPLSVPFAGRLLAWALRAWHGCTAGAGRTLGVLRLDAPPWSGAARQPIDCAMLGTGGREPARLPVSLSATVRMQSPAREAGAAAPRPSAPDPTTPDPTPQPPAQEGPADPRHPPDARAPAGDPSEPAAPSAPSGATAPGIGPPGAQPPADPAFCAASTPYGTR